MTKVVAELRMRLAELRPRRAGVAAMLRELDRQIAELQTALKEALKND
jgi:hypothetical protein